MFGYDLRYVSKDVCDVLLHRHLYSVDERIASTYRAEKGRDGDRKEWSADGHQLSVGHASATHSKFDDSHAPSYAPVSPLPYQSLPYTS